MAKTLAILIVLICSTANAQCYTYGRSYYVQAAPVVQPIITYRVGQDIEIASIVAKTMQHIQASQQQTQQHGYQSQYQGYPQQQQGQPQYVQRPQVAGATGVSSGVLHAKCASCHNGPQSRAGYAWDMQQPMSDKHFRLTVEWLSGEKVSEAPKEMQGVLSAITPQEKGPILKDLIALPKVLVDSQQQGNYVVVPNDI